MGAGLWAKQKTHYPSPIAHNLAQQGVNTRGRQY
jgi:hypothetical protein